MKPKIHAFCDAGCKWETVHKDDFLRSASVIEIPLDGATECELEVGAKYRFIPTIDYYNWTEDNSTVLIFGEDHGEGVFNTNLISYYDFDTFRTEHTIEIIAVRIKGGQLEMAYLLDEVRHVFTYPRDIGGATSVDELTLTFKLLYVDKIYRYNKYAEIEQVGGSGLKEITLDELRLLINADNLRKPVILVYYGEVFTGAVTLYSGSTYYVSAKRHVWLTGADGSNVFVMGEYTINIYNDKVEYTHRDRTVNLSTNAMTLEDRNMNFEEAMAKIYI